jgi:hypothetical protein
LFALFGVLLIGSMDQMGMLPGLLPGAHA